MDVTEIAIGGVALVWLIPRLTEFLKVLGLTGKRNIWIAVFVVGLLFSGVAAALSEGLIPAIALPWVRVGAVALGGALAACASIGEYELQKRAR